MKRTVCAALCALLLLTGCSAGTPVEQKKYQATFLTLFDTVTTMVGFAATEEEFSATAQSIHDELLIVGSGEILIQLHTAGNLHRSVLQTVEAHGKDRDEHHNAGKFS